MYHEPRTTDHASHRPKHIHKSTLAVIQLLLARARSDLNVAFLSLVDIPHGYSAAVSHALRVSFSAYYPYLLRALDSHRHTSRPFSPFCRRFRFFLTIPTGVCRDAQAKIASAPNNSYSTSFELVRPRRHHDETAQDERRQRRERRHHDRRRPGATIFFFFFLVDLFEPIAVGRRRRMENKKPRGQGKGGEEGEK